MVEGRGESCCGSRQLTEQPWLNLNNFLKIFFFQFYILDACSVFHVWPISPLLFSFARVGCMFLGTKKPSLPTLSPFPSPSLAICLQKLNVNGMGCLIFQDWVMYQHGRGNCFVFAGSQINFCFQTFGCLKWQFLTFRRKSRRKVPLK